MHKHAIILPLKETFSKKSAGAVSIWVKDYLSKSKLKKNIYIFTQDTNESLIQKKNVYKIIKLIERKHSYKCPCIVFFDIEIGNKKFLSWIKKNS